jgi:hypothetical protein
MSIIFRTTKSADVTCTLCEKEIRLTGLFMSFKIVGEFWRIHESQLLVKKSDDAQTAETALLFSTPRDVLASESPMRITLIEQADCLRLEKMDTLIALHCDRGDASFTIWVPIEHLS